MSKPIRRLYRIRLLPALLLSLPVVVFCIWYSWQAFSNFNNYKQFTNSKQELTLELFQLSLHDMLARDLRWLTAKEVKQSKSIEDIYLDLSTQNRVLLMKGVGKSQQRPWVSGKMIVNDNVYHIQVRLRGSRHWHHLTKKKSLKIKIVKGPLYKGLSTFNLVNDGEPFVIGEKIITDVANENRLITPEYSFARLNFCGEDLGMFHLLSQPDESLFFNNQLFGGNIYSGGLPSNVKSDALWSSTKYWTKVAQCPTTPSNNTKDLEQLLKKIKTATYKEFAEFANQSIDMDSFATFEAMDIIFGTEQHGFRENQKLYFDSYRGKWMPIAWDFRGFKHNKVFNRVENPIILRLKTIPEYMAKRNEKLFELLTGSCSLSSIFSRSKKHLKKIGPSILQDRLFTTYGQLPSIGSFYKKMLRPMSISSLYQVFLSEMNTYKKRQGYLLDELKRGDFGVTPVVNGIFKIIPTGLAHIRPEQIEVNFDSSCNPEAWQIFSSEGSLVAQSTTSKASFTNGFTLYPRTTITSRKKGDEDLEKHLTTVQPAGYDFIIKSTCTPKSIIVQATSGITGSTIYSTQLPYDYSAKFDNVIVSNDVVPQLNIGEVSPKPQLKVDSNIQKVTIGPGVVNFEKTTLFKPFQDVRVLPGTILKLGKNTSLIFHGKVRFEGTFENPIIIKKSGKHTFGAIALNGPNTKNSIFNHVHIKGGTSYKSDGVTYPGVINFHDTSSITMTNCILSDNHKSGDFLHSVYTDDLLIENVIINNASQDGMDLEFSTGLVKRVVINKTGDDCIDTMGSNIKISDSQVIGCKGNGISAGEKSSLVLQDNLIAKSGKGLLVKDSSDVESSNNLFYKNIVGIKAAKPISRYPGKIKIFFNETFVTESPHSFIKAKNGVQTDGALFTFSPSKDSFEHLVKNVLKIDNIQKLDSYLNSKPSVVLP